MSRAPLPISFDEKGIDAVFSALNQCHQPGAAVGIAIRGRPVYRRGFGLANIELPVLLTPSIRMRIASVTKHFTCLAYMLLCEAGKAALDDSVGTYLAELHPVARNVTLRQLMGNVGGLRDAHDVCWQFSGFAPSVTTAELLSLYCDMDDVNAAPGTAWVYSNGGFLILSTVIERLCDQSLEQVLRERIFEPAGMRDTMLIRCDTDYASLSAASHVTNPNGGFKKPHMGTAWAGEGGVVSTIDDMLRWLAHMDAPTIGNSTTWAAMKAPQTLVNGTATGYGLGLITERYRGVEVLYHPGGWIGGSAQMLKVPAADLDVVVLVNRDDYWAMQLVNDVLDACLQGLDTVITTQSGSLSIGTFQSPVSGRVIQLLSRGDQQIAAIDGNEVPVALDRDGVLRPTGVYRYVKQALKLFGDPTTPRSIQINDFGNIDELVRREPPACADWGAIEGCYRSEMTSTEVVIGGKGNDCRAMSRGKFGVARYRLECLADGIWRATSATHAFLGGILSFDAAGTAFRFSSYRTLALRFGRVA